MIAFATLFLGLVVGPHDIELTVGDDVHRVELRLDSTVIESRDEPPWRFHCDLGTALTPHILEAVAFDRDDRELTRARQWLNLPRPPADATAVLETRDDGRTVARLAWQSLTGAEPESITASFDGQPLELTDPTRFVLPAFDPAQLHFLRVVLRFPNQVDSVIEATLGGTYFDQINTEITALPVRATGRRRKVPPPRQLAGKLHAGETPLDVVAVDRGGGVLLVVADRSAAPDLDRIAEMLPQTPRRTLDARVDRFMSLASLRKDQRVRFLWPITRRQQVAGGSYDLFPTSIDFPASAHGLFFLLRWAKTPPGFENAPQRLADAVANAAIAAAATRRPRAVLLLLGSNPRDTSGFEPATIRSFLHDLRVPLFVWSTSESEATTQDGWQSVVDVSNPGKLERGAKELAKALDEQLVVWIDGLHRPQDVVLSADSGLVPIR